MAGSQMSKDNGYAFIKMKKARVRVSPAPAEIA